MHTTAIDFTPIINVVLQTMATVLLGAGTWGISRLVHWLGLKNAAQASANLDDALGKSVAYGLQQSQQLIKANGWDHADVRSATLASAAPYMIAHFPDALKAVGCDLSNTDAVTACVTQALDRAFPQAVRVAATSPATLPAVPPSLVVSAPAVALAA